MVKKAAAKPEGLPDRPLTPFLHWLQDNIADIKVKHPEFSVSQLQKKAEDIWQKQPEEVQQVYTSRSLAQRVKFLFDGLGHLKKLNKTNPEEKTKQIKKIQKLKSKVTKKVVKSKAAPAFTKGKKVTAKAATPAKSAKKAVQTKAKKVNSIAIKTAPAASKAKTQKASKAIAINRQSPAPKTTPKTKPVAKKAPAKVQPVRKTK